ncbi:hypothetical protein PybrP1_001569 [[Pythium] brassicae (nom. inval.)]|nr:hypothetical protein PybrP1_001569 [[Pythium] brassicae (nom. inval.)]
MEPCVALVDVVRDGFRRAFFLEALEDERPALELRLAFLSHTHAFAALAGRPSLLLGAARELVQLYLRDPVPLLGDDAPPRVQQLAARVARVVACGRSPSALFAGLEAHVRRQLADDAFPRFLASAHYQRLCDALRDRRELPLGEVLVSRQRTRFLERHLRAQQPDAVGNLRFWVDVQTAFLPLIQTTLFSVALFEEIQAAVRRIYNAYLTTSSPSAATLLSDELRKDTLKRIVVLQGEPFSPPRYAGLFRRAQETVWEWLQADVYPAFRQSPFYVLLVVEIENLEADWQLRRLSEQVRARTTAVGSGAGGSAQRRLEAKTSAVIVPVVPGLLGPPVARTHAWLRAHAARVDASVFQREILGLEEASDCTGWRQRTSVFFHSIRSTGGAADDTSPTLSHSASPVGASSATASKATLHFGASYDLVCRSANAASTSHLAYCWSQQSVKALPAVLSPSHRMQQLAPKPTVHEFLFPSMREADDGAEDEEEWSYGVCLTRWRAVELQSSSLEDSLRSAPSATPATAADCSFTFGSLSDKTTATTAEPTSVKLSARFSGFYLGDELCTSALPLHWVFKELSTQTITSVLALLLVERSVMLVSERRSALLLVGQALKDLLLPFQWAHFFLPFCPVDTANALCSDGFFSSSVTSSSPFIVGFEGALAYQKQADSSAEQRHRIRNSIYNTHKVTLQLAPPASASAAAAPATTTLYARSIFQSHAAVLDIDNDDLYLPGKTEVPEFPHALVRSLEANVKEVLARPQLVDADSQLFRPQRAMPPAFADDMLLAADDGARMEGDADADAALERGARLALLRFLESLFGDVAFHLCSVNEELAADEGGESSEQQMQTQRRGAPPESVCLVFEIDAFLDAHIALGCREFFRQCFQSELFRDFLLRQYAQFALVDLRPPRADSSDSAATL